MSRINTNVSSLVAGRILGQQNKGLTQSLERLSTGLAINRGADNPAGLIASEKLRSEKASISAAIGNAERAEQIVNVAEGGLQEVSSLLLELQSLVSESGNEAGLSDAEKEANQLQVDSILGAIDRISQSTSFAGTQLLNGTYDYQVTGVNAKVDDYQVNAAKFEHDGSRTVQVLVTASAQHGALFLSTGGNLNLGGATSSFVFEVTGSKGSREFSFGSGTTRAVIVSAINTFTSVTGISAGQQGTGIILKSEEYGTSEFVEVDILDEGGITGSGGIHTLSTTNEATVKTTGNTAFSVGLTARDEGQDVAATINGKAAAADGKTVRLATDDLDIKMVLTDGTGGGATKVGAFSALTVSGGGAKFNIGPSVDLTSQANIGISNIATRTLGTKAIGYLDELGSGNANNVVDGDISQAQKIVNSAIDKVSSLRGRLGAFQKNTIGSSISSLGVALENTSAAESAIRDTDFAEETAALTRSQILAAAGSTALSIANARPQSVLQLLG